MLTEILRNGFEYNHCLSMTEYCNQVGYDEQHNGWGILVVLDEDIEDGDQRGYIELHRLETGEIWDRSFSEQFSPTTREEAVAYVKNLLFAVEAKEGNQ